MSRPRSPIWRRIVKTWKSQYNAQHNLCMNETHVILLYCCTCAALLHVCCAAVHGVWLGGCVGGSGAVRVASAVVLLYILTPNSTCEELSLIHI